jgi:copper chaperone NosL
VGGVPENDQPRNFSRGERHIMKTSNRILFALAALLLIPLYFMPFWSISMKAPQFPEGIGMYIHIDDVTGHSRHDLQSINILNHYIGMQEINVDEIPEIRIMPWIIAFLIGLGIIAAAAGTRPVLAIWIGLFILLAIAGMIDYYLWGYEYGHNLSPDAPIKVPGMSYQPPLIGSKQLLNIRASSWPYWGSLFIALSMVTAGFAAFREYFTGKTPSNDANTNGAPRNKFLQSEVSQ